MWWVAGDKNVAEALQNLYAEIERGSDRSVAILAGSIIETHVAKLLRHSLTVDDKLWESRTHSSAPLGSFSIKIDLLYMLGRITAEAHRDLILERMFGTDLRTIWTLQISRRRR
jgi:DNA-binding MltR family transcriptional regulator